MAMMAGLGLVLPFAGSRNGTVDRVIRNRANDETNLRKAEEKRERKRLARIARNKG